MALQARGVESEQDWELRQREENVRKLREDNAAAERRRAEAAREARAATDLNSRIRADPDSFSGRDLQQYLARITGYGVGNFQNSARYRDKAALAREVEALRAGVQARISANPRLYSEYYAPK